jgi:uncharacterized protein (TIGR04255 family)
MTATSRPLRGHNAIEQATFVVVLNEAIDSTCHKAVTAALDRFSDELPGIGTGAEAGVFKIHFANRPPEPEITRFAMGANGREQWRVSIDANVVQVVFSEYSNFNHALGLAIRYLSAILEAAGQNYRAAEVGLQFVDKFLYGIISNDDYDIDELYRPTSRYLTEQARTCGMYWHVFQGWFEPCDARSRFLHQLNVSNTDLPDGQLAALVDYRGTLRHVVQPVSLDELTTEDGSGKSALEQSFRHLHATNRAILEDLLTEEKLKQIGIRSGT